MKPGASERELVLVVDNDELVRWSAAEGLKEYGYAVEVAANAHGALQRYPDAAVALLNHDLPGVDGLNTADALHRRHPRCAIVLMTADLTPDLRRRARERGVVGVLEKPFSLETLAAAIDDALDLFVEPEGQGSDRPRETAARQEV
jgi:CheY-like chemotaxis protein